MKNGAVTHFIRIESFTEDSWAPVPGAELILRWVPVPGRNMYLAGRWCWGGTCTSLGLSWCQSQGGTCTLPGTGTGTELVSRWTPVPGQNLYLAGRRCWGGTYTSLGAGTGAELLPCRAPVPGRNLYLSRRRCQGGTWGACTKPYSLINESISNLAQWSRFR